MGTRPNCPRTILDLSDGVVASVVLSFYAMLVMPANWFIVHTSLIRNLVYRLKRLFIYENANTYNLPHW